MDGVCTCNGSLCTCSCITLLDTCTVTVKRLQADLEVYSYHGNCRDFPGYEVMAKHVVIAYTGTTIQGFSGGYAYSVTNYMHHYCDNI